MNASQESPNLDFLRSAAVLFVVGVHVLFVHEQRHSQYVNGLGIFHSIGQWGVLIFFVHTSLVLMLSLERQRLRWPGKPSYIPFLTRRLFRIFPLSIVVVLFVTILKLPVAYLTGGRFMAAHLRWEGIAFNLLLLQNLTHTDSVIVPLWSLPYEMQMYLFLPLLFVLICSPRYAWSIPCLWCAAVFFGSHGGWVERNGIPDLIIYVPCFIAGVIAYKLTKTWNLHLPAALWPLVLGILTLWYLMNPTPQRAWYSCAILAIAIPQFKEMTNRTICKIAQTIARYSYGIYLVHFICIWLAFQAFDSVSAWQRWAILPTTLSILSYLIYHLVEKPMIRRGERVSSVLRDWLGSASTFDYTVEGAVER